MRATFWIAAAAVFSLLAARPAAAQAPETIVVNNALDRAVLVWVDGVPREVVPAAGEKAIAGDPAGAVTLMATDVSSGSVIATEHTTLSEGEIFTWTLYFVPVPGEAAGLGTVVLVNGFDQVIEVTLGGHTSAVLLPGATRVLPRVVAGSVVAVASAPAGASLATETLTVTDGEVTSWRVSP